MEDTTALSAVISSCAPIAVALIGIIPTIVSNRKKTDDKIDRLATKLDKHIEEDQEDQMMVCRSRILRAAKDVRNGDIFDYDYWNSLKIDWTKYTKYHDEHPDFPDGICDGTIKFLSDKLDELTREGAFDGKIK